MRRTVFVVPFLGLILVSGLVRLPYFLNPNGFSSDQAVVGLQARHLLRGEWSWFLWDCGYQASFEPLLTAAASWVTPNMRYAMLLVGYAGFLVAIGLIFSSLRRSVGTPKAFLVTLFVVLTATPTLWQTIYPPRMWAITFVFLSVWCLVGSKFFLGPLALFFATYVEKLESLFSGLLQ